MKIKEILLELNVSNTDDIKKFINDMYVDRAARPNDPTTPAPVTSWFNKQAFRFLINDEKLAVPATRLWVKHLYAYRHDDPPDWLLPAIDRGEDIVRIDLMSDGNAYARRLKKQLHIVRAWLIWEYEQGNEKLMSKLPKLTVPEAIKKARVWFKEDEQRKIDQSKAGTDYKVVMKFPDGYKIIQMISSECKDLEGDIMQNCIDKNYSTGQKMEANVKLFSLRDPNNKAHVHMETSGRHLKYVKGKQNRSPIKKYVPYITAWAKKMKLDTYTNFKLKYGALRTDGSNEIDAHNRRMNDSRA